MKRDEILAEATRCVMVDRNSTYGRPENLFAALAIVRRGVDMARGHRARIVADEALDLVALKLVRAAYNPSHIDSSTDGAAYFALFGELATGEQAND